MLAVMYVIIFTFHPKLNFERVITELSFGHSREKLLTIKFIVIKFVVTKLLQSYVLENLPWN